MARAGAGAAVQSVRSLADRATESLSQSVQAGRESGWSATGGGPVSGAAASPPSPRSFDNAPQWARQLRAEQASRAHRHAALQAIKDGDRPGAPANPDLSSKDV